MKIEVKRIDPATGLTFPYIVLLLLGTLIVSQGSAVAPFIYTLF